MSGWIFALALLALAAAAFAWSRRSFTVVYEYEWGLLYEDGLFKRVLPAGRYSTGGFGKSRHILKLMRMFQTVQTGPVEAVSQDRFPLRLSALFWYDVQDARAVHETQSQYRLMAMAQQALVQLAVEHPLETLLSNRAEIEQGLAPKLAAQFPEFEIRAGYIMQVTLPPEIRRLVVEVERAKLEGQAAVERARGEHAALRTLANAARLVKDNPELMGLRTLQAVASAKNATLVIGNDGLVSGQPPPA